MQLTGGLGKWLSDNAVGIVALAVETRRARGNRGGMGSGGLPSRVCPVGFQALTLSMATAGFLLCDLSEAQVVQRRRNFERRSERDGRSGTSLRMCPDPLPRQRSCSPGGARAWLPDPMTSSSTGTPRPSPESELTDSVAHGGDRWEAHAPMSTPAVNRLSFIVPEWLARIGSQPCCSRVSRSGCPSSLATGWPQATPWVPCLVGVPAFTGTSTWGTGLV